MPSKNLQIALPANADAMAAARAEIGAIPDAPSDGYSYARKDGAWVLASSSSPGSVSWGDIAGVPEAFNPESHASRHAAGGSDALSRDSWTIANTLTEYPGGVIPADYWIEAGGEGSESGSKRFPATAAAFGAASADLSNSSAQPKLTRWRVFDSLAGARASAGDRCLVKTAGTLSLLEDDTPVADGTWVEVKFSPPAGPTAPLVIAGTDRISTGPDVFDPVSFNVARDEHWLFIRDGDTWTAELIDSATSLSGTLQAANNLSDVANATTARGNLGLSDAAITALADTAIAASGKTLTNAAELQQTLPDGATINWNLNLGGVAKVTLGGNRTIAAPTNLRNGAVYVLEIIQDATGGRTLTWNSVFVWPGGTAPTLTSAATKRDIANFFCSGGKLYGAISTNFA